MRLGFGVSVLLHYYFPAAYKVDVGVLWRPIARELMKTSESSVMVAESPSIALSKMAEALLELAEKARNGGDGEEVMRMEVSCVSARPHDAAAFPSSEKMA